MSTLKHYFESRALEERSLARECQFPEAQLFHETLAEAYELLASQKSQRALAGTPSRDEPSGSNRFFRREGMGAKE